jgi:hypothetical protein
MNRLASNKCKVSLETSHIQKFQSLWATCQPSRTARKKRVTKHDLEKEQTLPVLDIFHSFSRLPPELREMIWKFVMPPRLITWRNDRPPAVLHACHESRRIWLKKHKIEHWRTHIFDHESLFIDHNADILYFEGVIPGSEQWTEIPHKIKAPTGPALYWPKWIGKDDVGGVKWLEEVQKLAIPSEFALKEFNFAPQSPALWRLENLNPWAKLNTLCPNLRELIIVFGGGLSKESVIEDWVELGSRLVPVEPWCWRWDIPNFRVKSFAAYCLRNLKQVEVKFMEAKKFQKHVDV